MTRNRWHTALMAAGMLLMPVIAGVGLRPAAVAADSSYTYDFEQSVKPWQAGANSYLTRSTGDNLCPLELGTGMAQLSTPLIGADTEQPDLHVRRLAGPWRAARSSSIGRPSQVLGGAPLQPNVYAGASANPGADAWRSAKGCTAPTAGLSTTTRRRCRPGSRRGRRSTSGWGPA